MATTWKAWKKRLLTIPRRAVRGWFRPVRRLLHPADYGDLKKRVESLEYNQRNFLFALHSEHMGDFDQRTALRRSEAWVFSGYGEAGVLLYVFSKIGVTDRRVVELGMRDITRCNSTNLVLSFGWSSLLIDPHAARLKRAKAFYEAHTRVGSSRVTCVETRIQPKDINELMAENGCEGEIDLLSIDIDGNDYWVWKAIDVIRPRVVMIAYNPSLGPDEALVTPYIPDLIACQAHPFGWYHSASLLALERLGRKKGYILIGCESGGRSACFVLEDIATGRFEALTAREAYYPEARRLKVASAEEQLQSVRQMPLQRDEANGP